VPCLVDELTVLLEDLLPFGLLVIAADIGWMASMHKIAANAVHAVAQLEVRTAFLGLIARVELLVLA
jgi:hypothetical protein